MQSFDELGEEMANHNVVVNRRFLVCEDVGGRPIAVCECFSKERAKQISALHNPRPFEEMGAATPSEVLKKVAREMMHTPVINIDETYLTGWANVLLLIAEKIRNKKGDE